MRKRQDPASLEDRDKPYVCDSEYHAQNNQTQNITLLYIHCQTQHWGRSGKTTNIAPYSHVYNAIPLIMGFLMSSFIVATYLA